MGIARAAAILRLADLSAPASLALCMDGRSAEMDGELTALDDPTIADRVDDATCAAAEAADESAMKHGDRSSKTVATPLGNWHVQVHGGRIKDIFTRLVKKRQGGHEICLEDVQEVQKRFSFQLSPDEVETHFPCVRPDGKGSIAYRDFFGMMKAMAQSGRLDLSRCDAENHDYADENNDENGQKTATDNGVAAVDSGSGNGVEAEVKPSDAATDDTDTVPGEEALQVIAAMEKRKLSCSWNGECIIVEPGVRIESPYTPQSCSAETDMKSQAVLKRVRNVLALERATFQTGRGGSSKPVAAVTVTKVAEKRRPPAPPSPKLLARVPKSAAPAPPLVTTSADDASEAAAKTSAPLQPPEPEQAEHPALELVQSRAADQATQNQLDEVARSSEDDEEADDETPFVFDAHPNTDTNWEQWEHADDPGYAVPEDEWEQLAASLDMEADTAALGWTEDGEDEEDADMEDLEVAEGMDAAEARELAELAKDRMILQGASHQAKHEEEQYEDTAKRDQASGDAADVSADGFVPFAEQGSQAGDGSARNLPGPPGWWGDSAPGNPDNSRNLEPVANGGYSKAGGQNPPYKASPLIRPLPDPTPKASPTAMKSASKATSKTATSKYIAAPVPKNEAPPLLPQLPPPLTSATVSYPTLPPPLSALLGVKMPPLHPPPLHGTLGKPPPPLPQIPPVPGPAQQTTSSKSAPSAHRPPPVLPLSGAATPQGVVASSPHTARPLNEREYALHKDLVWRQYILRLLLQQTQSELAQASSFFGSENLPVIDPPPLQLQHSGVQQISMSLKQLTLPYSQAPPAQQSGWRPVVPQVQMPGLPPAMRGPPTAPPPGPYQAPPPSLSAPNSQHAQPVHGQPAPTPASTIASQHALHAQALSAWQQSQQAKPAAGEPVRQRIPSKAPPLPDSPQPPPPPEPHRSSQGKDARLPPSGESTAARPSRSPTPPLKAPPVAPTKGSAVRMQLAAKAGHPSNGMGTEAKQSSDAAAADASDIARSLANAFSFLPEVEDDDNSEGVPTSLYGSEDEEGEEASAKRAGDSNEQEQSSRKRARTQDSSEPAQQQPTPAEPERKTGMLPSLTDCTRCSRRGLPGVENAGVFCGRITTDGEFHGCGAAICWRCMRRGPNDQMGTIRTSKEECEGMGSGAWWMHEFCMSEQDKLDYYGSPEASAQPVEDELVAEIAELAEAEELDANQDEEEEGMQIADDGYGPIDGDDEETVETTQLESAGDRYAWE